MSEDRDMTLREEFAAWVKFIKAVWRVGWKILAYLGIALISVSSHFARCPDMPARSHFQYSLGWPVIAVVRIGQWVGTGDPSFSDSCKL